MIETILLIVHVLMGVGVIALVLLQQGKGADAGASFGGGASQTVFGSIGAGGFLVKLTAGLGAIFFATSLSLAVVAKQKADKTFLNDLSEFSSMEANVEDEKTIEKENFSDTVD